MHDYHDDKPLAARAFIVLTLVPGKPSNYLSQYERVLQRREI